MQVIYRITSIPSTNPSPVFQGDKNKLNELCLNSFLRAFSDVRPKITFIADHVTDFDFSMCIFDHEVIRTNEGINKTMLMSYDLASQMDDYVLFQECDYLYHSVIGNTYLEALEELGLVSPYDHKNFYVDKTLHSERCKIRLVSDTHFRTTERNTMTWGCHSSLVKDHKDVLDKYGYLDGDVWYELKSKGHELWVPIPSFATHMVRDWMAPSINWEDVCATLLS